MWCVYSEMGSSQKWGVSDICVHVCASVSRSPPWCASCCLLLLPLSPDSWCMWMEASLCTHSYLRYQVSGQEMSLSLILCLFLFRFSKFPKYLRNKGFLVFFLLLVEHKKKMDKIFIVIIWFLKAIFLVQQIPKCLSYSTQLYLFKKLFAFA